MGSPTLFEDESAKRPTSLRGYDIEFELRGDQALLVLAGDLDAAAIDALRGLIGCIEQVPGIVHVRADAVTGADLVAFDPLLQAARDRRAKGLPGLCVDSLSEAAQDLLAVLGLPDQPPVLLDGQHSIDEEQL